MADEDVVTSGPGRGGRILRTPEERAERSDRENEGQRLEREQAELDAKTPEEVLNEIKELISQSQLRTYARETKLKLTQSAARTGTAPDQLSGSEKDPKTARGKAATAKENAQRILMAAKTGKLHEPTGVTPGAPGQISDFAADALKKISDVLPADAISENSGAFLYDLFSGLLGNEFEDFESILNNARDDLQVLITADPNVYNHLSEALRNLGRDNLIPEARLDVVLPTGAALESDMRKRMAEERDPELQRLDEDLRRALRRYIDERDNEVIRAIYSPNQFMEFVKKVEADPEDKYGDKLKRLRTDAPGSDEYWEEVSAVITREISFTFGKLFRSAASQHKDKFLDEIANENALESINLAKTYLNTALQKLSERFTDADLRKDLGIDELQDSGALKFFSKRKRQFETERVINYTDHLGNARTHTVLQDRRISVGRAENVEIYEFLSGVKYQVERFIDHILPYNHDVQALFLRQAGQDGTFWGQIGGFAGAKLSTFDVDSLNDIPDNEYVMAAFRMYSKYVKADFARYDWNNKAGRFTENFDSPNTPIQHDVVKDLKKIFPELHDHHNKWRIDQAMNIAIGVSRGVFLTEPTTVAWADAPHHGEGKATFESYYTNDNAALLGFNMQHNVDRWKTQNVTSGPVIHMPVAGRSPASLRGITRRWDHARLWEWLKKRENSYVNGLPAFGDVHPVGKDHRGHGGGHGHRRRDRFGRLIDRFNARFVSKVPLTSARRDAKREKWESRGERRMMTFVEALPNIANIGGPIERGTWRNAAYEGWVIYDKEGNPDKIETFKSLENIGFEAVKWWVKEAKLTSVPVFNDTFGEYLFNKYIQPNSGTTKSYTEYTEDLKAKVKAKEGKNAEKQYAGVLVHRALAYMLKERVPTLMVAIERTRTTDNGIRAWKALRSRCGWGGGEEKGERFGEIQDTNRMDRAMKNIMLAEQRVRQETSQQMKDGINDQVSAHRDNPHFKPNLRAVTFEDGKDYRLTEERLKKQLTFFFTHHEDGTIKAEDRVEFDDAVKLFQETQNYLNEEYIDDFAEKMRYNGKPEKFFPFAIATEELDTSFLTFQSAGPGVMRRALSEIGAVETNVVKNIQDNFLGKFRDIAMHEHSFAPLVHAMHEVHNQLNSLHGEAAANEVADYMARVATAYFKKDSNSTGWLGKVMNVGKPHSLAGHFAGGSWKNVWEWDVAEQESFYREIDKLGILPDRPMNMNIPEDIVPKKFLGITYGTKKVILEDELGEPEHSGLKIRKDMGARYSDVLFELIRKWLPIAAIAFIGLYISKALKEAADKKGH